MGSPPSNPSRSVLVVDDDPLIAEFMHILLLRQGHQPVVLRDPEAALAWVAQHPAQLDIAVLDYRLPRMDGLELARRLRQLIPGLPVILLTGAIAAPELAGCAEWHSCLTMHKPFRVPELQAKLEQLLGSGPGGGRAIRTT